MKKPWLLAVLLMMLCIITSCSLPHNLDEGGNNMQENEIFEFPGNAFATYQHYDRNLSINDFVNIAIGTEYEAVVSMIGEPNGLVGSGMSWPYYQLQDHSVVVLMFNKDSAGNYFEVISIRILDSTGRVFELIE